MSNCEIRYYANDMCLAIVCQNGRLRVYIRMDHGEFRDMMAGRQVCAGSKIIAYRNEYILIRHRSGKYTGFMVSKGRHRALVAQYRRLTSKPAGKC